MNNSPYNLELATLLQNGGTAVIPTDTLYGIVTGARNRSSVEQLYSIKRRNPAKPYIILINEIADLNYFNVEVSRDTKLLLEQYWPGPVSIILPCPDPDLAYLHRGTDSLAFRMPANTHLRDLLRQTGPLVAPSANPEGLPPAQTIDEAKSYFSNSIDDYVEGPVNDRPSKIIQLVNDQVVVLRP